MSPVPLRIAVCLYNQVTYLDAHGPLELLGLLSPEAIAQRPLQLASSPYSFVPTYLSHSLDHVKPSAGPMLVPDRTYDESIDDQFDILLIPGGIGARPENVHPSLTAFVKKQGPRAKYIITVCTGSWILAKTGLLNGLRATSNKSVFTKLKEDTKDLPIEWVAKARWVVADNKRIWTASGVTAGMDLAASFLRHLVGEELTSTILGVVELSHKDEGDDEFAAFYGLI